MTAHHLSISGLGLAQKCAYSYRPDVPRGEDKAGARAIVGTIVHTLAEAHVAGRAHSEMDGFDPELVSEAIGIYGGPLRSFLNSKKWDACEIGLEYDATSDTAERCLRRGEPGYLNVPPMHLRGTLDLLSVKSVEAEIYDIKTGKHVDNYEQLYGQAVAVSRKYKVDTVRVAYLYARKTKCEPSAVEVLDRDSLDYQAGRITRLLKKLPIAEPVRGDWCWVCRSKADCPAWGV